MSGTTEKAKTRLEELEVEEVSIVDRPANRVRFLIVKRQEDEMPRSAMPADDRSDVRNDDPTVTIEEPEQDDDEALALLLELNELEVDDDPEIDDDPKPPTPPIEDSTDESSFSQIFKAGNAGGALKVAQAGLQKLMGAVNAMKRLGDKPLTPPVIGVLRGVAGALNLMAGAGKSKDKDKTEKVQEGTLKQATAAMERLMSLVNRLKEMDASADVPGEVYTEAKAIAGLIQGLLQKYPSPTAGGDKGEKGDSKTEKRFEVFVPRDAKADDADPEIIVKAGAKMKRTRLSKLKQAVKLLTEVLGEIDPEDIDRGKKKGKVTKGDDDNPSALEAAIITVAETVKSLGERMDKLVEDLTSKIGEVTKRVETIEGEAPAGTDTDDDSATTMKKGAGQSLFHNVIHQ
jgi:hypothetical protein